MQCQTDEPASDGSCTLCLGPQLHHIISDGLHLLDLLLGSIDFPLHVGKSGADLIQSPMYHGTAVICALQPVIDPLQFSKYLAKGPLNTGFRHSLQPRVSHPCRAHSDADQTEAPQSPAAVSSILR